MDNSNGKEQPKIQEDGGSGGRRDRKKEVETQAQTVLILGLDLITIFVYRLDGPLGEGNV
jgi:hypothetical protein